MMIFLELADIVVEGRPLLSADSVVPVAQTVDVKQELK